MSIEAIAWAWEQAVGDPTRKLILLALANYAKPYEATCFPSQAYLAMFAEVSERSVRAHLKRLEDDGYIVRRARFNGQGARTSDEVLVLMPRIARPVPEKAPPHGTVYVLRDDHDGRVKIGFTAGPVAKRQRAIENTLGRPLELVRSVEASRDHEARLHEHFAAARLPGSGEWFALTDEVDAWLSSAPEASFQGIDKDRQPAAGGSQLPPIRKNFGDVQREAPKETATSEPSSRSVAREDAVPDDFPEQIRPHARIVHPLLVGLAERKGGKRPSARALASVLMARPTHALVKEAYDCVAWYEDNRTTVRDVVASYRNWLDKTQPLAATERLPGEAGPLPQGVTPIRPRNAREQQEADTQRRLAKLRELGYEPGQLGGLA